MLREEEGVSMMGGGEQQWPHHPQAQAGRPSLSFMTKCARTGGTVFKKALHLTLREASMAISASMGFQLPIPFLHHDSPFIKPSSVVPLWSAGYSYVSTDIPFVLVWLGHAAILMSQSRAGW